MPSAPINRVLSIKTFNSTNNTSLIPRSVPTALYYPQCTRSKNKVKVVTRHVWEEHKEKVRLNRLSKSGNMLYKFRKEKIERSFVDSKELHGLRYCRLRGLKNASE